MIYQYLDNINKLYDHVDAVMIINREGYIEYSVIYNSEMNSLVNDSFIGKHVFEVYPSLTEETSNHFRVVKTHEPILNETQNLVDLYGRAFTLVNSTFPIEHNGEIIGSIEVSIIVSSSTKENKSALNSKKISTEGAIYDLDHIITASPLVTGIKERIKKLSVSESPVMIYGETGTGKELIAQSIHNQSLRKAKAFISINCAAIPGNIVESMLYGTEKGSYTGAEDKKGLFELADGGTLFLDELQSMPIEQQPKLLKAIEEKRIRRIGGERQIPVDIRFISAMNSNPAEAVQKELLREDLYYRLNVIQISTPALRERREDIELLTRYFIEKFSKTTSKSVKGVSSLVKEVFDNYSWKGNIRELRNVIEYGVNVCEGEYIAMHDIPDSILYPTDGDERHMTLTEGHTLKEAMETYEKSIIINTMTTSRSVTAAAKRLGLTRQALQYKLDKYGLDKYKLH